MSTKIKLLKDETKKLEARLEVWPTLTKDDRNREREAFVTDFLKCRDVDSTDEWKRDTLRTKINQWFSNHGSHSQSRLPGSLKMHWTARQVFNERMADKIARKQDKLLQKATEEGKNMIDIVALNKARMMVWSKLSEEERAEFVEEADRWTAEGPDPMSKRDVIEKRVPGWVDSFSSLLWDQANVMALITMCYVDEDGNVVVTSFDVSDSWHRREKKTLQFTKVYPQWQRDHPANFIRFCRPVLCPDEEFDDDKAVLPKKRLQHNPIVFELYPEGDPILPPLSDVPGASQPRKDTFRRFLNAHYALACGVAGVPVPWGMLVMNNEKFLCPHSIVEGKAIADPSRMAGPVLTAVWAHIIHLQSLGDPEERFRFAKWYESETDSYYDAKYDGPPAPKKAPAAAKKARTGGPPATNPSNADRVHAGDIRLPTGAVVETGPELGHARQRGGVTHPSAKKSHPSKKTHRPHATSRGSRRDRKGKGRAAEESNTAASSSSEDQPSDPPLGSEGSADEFDFDALGGLFGADTAEDEETSAPGPSGTRHDDSPPRLPRTGMQGSGQSSRATRAQQAPAASRDLWAIENAPSIPSQPDSALVAQAKDKPPSWVHDVDDCVFAFLWALSGEGTFHNLLTGWRHMLDRRATFKDRPLGDWANWDHASVALPAVVHATAETWTRLLEWIDDAAPRANSSASDVQRWLLVVGMVLRDVNAVNEVEDDEDIVPLWPEYIRHSPANLSRDIIQRVEPMLQTVYRPLPADGALPTFHDELGSGSPSPPTKRHTRKATGGQTGAANRPVQRAGLERMLAVSAKGGKPVPTPHEAVDNGQNTSNHSAMDVELPSQTPAKRSTVPRRRGPPGLPAASFPSALHNMSKAREGGTASAAEVEAEITVSLGSPLTEFGPSVNPRSISEGLAMTGPGTARCHKTPVPIVLIDSTIADRLKRRRRGNDVPLPPPPTEVTEDAGEGGGLRRSNRSSKRKRAN